MESSEFKKIIEEYGKTILNICYKFTENEDEAKDIAQEVFIGIYKSLSSFRKESKLSTWIYRIAVNKSLDELKRKRRKKHSVFNKLTGTEVEEISDNINPHTILEESERWKILQKALDSIPEKQRIAITLSRIESLSSKEIAEILKCNVSAIDMLIYRAKQNLRKILIKQYDKLFLITFPLVFGINLV